MRQVFWVRVVSIGKSGRELITLLGSDAGLRDHSPPSAQQKAMPAMGFLRQ
jgi:hypothetical protein